MASGGLPICLRSSVRDRPGALSALTGPNVGRRECVLNWAVLLTAWVGSGRGEGGRAEGKDAVFTFLMESSLEFAAHSVDTSLWNCMPH